MTLYTQSHLNTFHFYNCNNFLISYQRPNMKYKSNVYLLLLLKQLKTHTHTLTLYSPLNSPFHQQNLIYNSYDHNRNIYSNNLYLSTSTIIYISYISMSLMLMASSSKSLKTSYNKVKKKMEKYYKKILKLKLKLKINVYFIFITAIN